MTPAERLRKIEVPSGKIDCVLDTDTYNEIDDQFALSLMMKSDKCNVRALYAAPFFNCNSTSPEDGMERSYNEILKLLTLMDMEDMKQNVFRGSRTYLPDEHTPVESEAARHLCELASSYSPESPLYVVAIGAITNVASALLMNPDIAEKTVVIWLGGHNISWPDTKEFNLRQDYATGRIIFGGCVPLIQVPVMGVVSEFYTTKPELEYWLRGKNPLCDYLCDSTIAAAESYAKGHVWSRIICDVCAVGWLLNDGGRFMDSVIEPTPMPTYDGQYEFNPSNPPYRRVTHIHRDALMEELFKVLVK